MRLKSSLVGACLQGEVDDLRGGEPLALRAALCGERLGLRPPPGDGERREARALLPLHGDSLGLRGCFGAGVSPRPQ